MRQEVREFDASNPKGKKAFYCHLGLLFKRCTLLLPTKDRLKYIHKILSETLTAGWDELECHRVYNFLCELTNLSRKMQTVVCNKPGQVIWQEMVEGPTDESSLKGLANAIKLLYDTGTKEWTADDVISLVDELSVVPREWLLENNARLLILSGNNICFTFMASKAVNGRAIELARLIVFLALVCEKELYCMDWTVRMMQKVCKVFSAAAERKSFLQSVANAFACVTMEMLQPIMSGNTRIMTRSKNPPVRQQAGCSALQLHPSSPRSPCSSRPLEQINNVGQNHQPYDGKEHEDENIQHGAILSRGVAWIPGK
ncbi:F-box protein 47 [Cricetulus griseus]